MSEEKELVRYKLLGCLHYCRRYKNIVRFDEELCGKCPYNKPKQ